MAIPAWRRREIRAMVLMGVVVTLVVLAVLVPLLKLHQRPDNRQVKSIVERMLGLSQSEAATDDTFIGLEQNDPRLVAYVRSHMLPPSPLPYNLSRPRKVHFSQSGQSEIAEKQFFNGMGAGFFVEVGALDGEYLSNTLYFEKYRGWSGLLVEPNAKLYNGLVQRHRKAYSIRTGLAFTTHAGVADYWPNMVGVGRVKPGMRNTVKIKLLPLYTLLLSLNVSQVDFFSLDIEGDEMKVLQTLPWDKIRFRLMCIEINHVPGGTKGILNYLEPRGYTFLGVKNIDAWFGIRDLLKETMNVDQYLKDNKVAEQRERILNK